MKTIKSNKQLRNEKQKIKQRKQELEVKIKKCWKALKSSAILNQLPSIPLEHSANANAPSIKAHLLKSTIIYLLNFIISRFSDKLVQKVFKK